MWWTVRLRKVKYRKRALIKIFLTAIVEKTGNPPCFLSFTICELTKFLRKRVGCANLFLHMEKKDENKKEESFAKIYEIGYHIIPAVAVENLSIEVDNIKNFLIKEK